MLRVDTCLRSNLNRWVGSRIRWNGIALPARWPRWPRRGMPPAAVRIPVPVAIDRTHHLRESRVWASASPAHPSDATAHSPSRTAIRGTSATSRGTYYPSTCTTSRRASAEWQTTRPRKAKKRIERRRITSCSWRLVHRRLRSSGSVGMQRRRRVGCYPRLRRCRCGIRSRAATVVVMEGGVGCRATQEVQDIPTSLVP